MYTRAFLLPVVALVLGVTTALPHPQEDPPYPLITQSPDASKACADLPDVTTLSYYLPPSGIPPPPSVVTKWCASGQAAPTSQAEPPPAPGYEGTPPPPSRKRSEQPAPEHPKAVDFSTQLLPLAAALQKMEKAGDSSVGSSNKPAKRAAEAMTIFVHDIPEIDSAWNSKRTPVVDDHGKPLFDTTDADTMSIMKREPIMSEEYIDPDWTARLGENSQNKWSPVVGGGEAAAI
ncbi:hypothetical protein BDZ85DRAFT_268475 [Elsinoe ampelina]|uniref:Uncharacterized protein n=1 Tax=Elsinoe ampelina TaxID=302913 RepID=A0A6A6G164_9PEZI|nr:hypothetical protein BDZ85DRAFT_268475 [Elsinoe ampelina]